MTSECTWEREVRRLYERSDMEVDEFEALLDIAMRGGQPQHPDLPLFPLPARPAPDSLASVLR